MRIMPHFSAEGLSNVYLISDDNGDGIIVDPAHLDTELMEIISQNCRNIIAVLITHSHNSHTAGLGTLMKIYSPVIYAYEPAINGFTAHQLHDEETIRIGTLSVKAMHVPGHSMDSLVYAVGSALFTGDTLSSGSIASTGSHVEKELLIKSLEEKIMHMDDNTLIYPGHGPLSKLRTEKMLNQDLLEAESLTLGRAYRVLS